MCVHIRSLLPLPLLLPIHPLHPVTSSHTPHLSRRFVSWPLTPPPRSDSFRSTVHNVQTPCRPLRTRQGGRVRGLQCLSCHVHTIQPRRPLPPPYTVVRSFVQTLLCAIIMCVYTYSFPPAPPPAPPHPPSSPCHIVTHTTLVTQVVSWPLTPPPPPQVQ